MKALASIRWTPLCLGALLFFVACTKNGGTSPLEDPPTGGDLDFSYVVHGVGDLTMEQLDEAEMKISVQKSTFQSEEVGLRIKDLPKGLEVDFSPGYALASYPSTLRFRAVRVPVGIYPLVLESYSSHTEIQSYPFELTITPYSNPAAAFHGEFTETRSCDVTGNDTHPSFLEPVEGDTHKVRIKGFWSSSWKSEVIVHLDPPSGTLTLPSQVVNQATVQGQGTYNDDTLRLDYTITTSVFVDQCQSVFIRKE